MAIGFRPPHPLPLIDERLYWSARKGMRVAESRVRVMAHGRELRVTVGADLGFSMLFRDDDGRKIGTHSTGTLQNFLGHGSTQDLDA